MDEEKAEEVATLLCEGYYTHDNPIFAEEAKQLNLNIDTSMPKRFTTCSCFTRSPQGHSEQSPTPKT